MVGPCTAVTILLCRTAAVPQGLYLGACRELDRQEPPLPASHRPRPDALAGPVPCCGRWTGGTAFANLVLHLYRIPQGLYLAAGAGLVVPLLLTSCITLYRIPQGLYLAAREELDRLDKENTELKDMIQAETNELTRSRCVYGGAAHGRTVG